MMIIGIINYRALQDEDIVKSHVLMIPSPALALDNWGR